MVKTKIFAKKLHHRQGPGNNFQGGAKWREDICSYFSKLLNYPVKDAGTDVWNPSQFR